MARPLRVDGTSGLIEMTDAELDLVSFYLRIAYASQLNSGGNGSLNVGVTGTLIGSASDSTTTQSSASQVGNLDGILNDFPAAPALGVAGVSTYNYYQVRTTPGFPSTATLDTDGFLVIDGTSGIKVVSTEAEIYNEVITHCINKMRSGDEVGTYRISTSQPSADWANKGVWHTDTTYSAGTTTYNLWLKTSGTTPTGSLPVVMDSTNGAQEYALSSAVGMVVNVLLPCLTRRLANGDLNYTVLADATGNRGAFYNTYQGGSSTTTLYSAPLYTTTSTPSGVATAVNSYSLNLA